MCVLVFRTTPTVAPQSEQFVRVLATSDRHRLSPVQMRFLHRWTYELDSPQLIGHLLLWQSYSNNDLLYQNGMLYHVRINSYI